MTYFEQQEFTPEMIQGMGSVDNVSAHLQLIGVTGAQMVVMFATYCGSAMAELGPEGFAKALPIAQDAMREAGEYVLARFAERGDWQRRES